MKLAPPPEKLTRDLAKLLRPDQVSSADSHRLSYGRDSNSKAMLWVRQNEVKYPPWAVVWPETSRQVAEVASFANERGLPLIPFGGGSGICGGTWALRGGIALDMKRMNRLLKVNTQAMEIRAQTGINGEILERELQRKSLTLGHFPSSIYVATLGGYLACRSAGQFSSRYGKIEDMVESIEVVLADGEIAELSSVKEIPGALDLKELFLGSEGTLGIMTEATLRVNPLPEKDLYWGFQFPSLETGLKAMRGLLQSGLKPSVLRLYDELDTKIFLSHGEESTESWWQSLIGKRTQPLLNWTKELSLKFALKNPSLLRAGLALLPRACLLILGFQGKTEEVMRWARRAGSICASARGKDLG
ncbi:MAG TPA: FAD-binding oxidoreductase, partial [bacterium]|nr:FAD-binding oxidoreductase [bacterium]